MSRSWLNRISKKKNQIKYIRNNLGEGDKANIIPIQLHSVQF